MKNVHFAKLFALGIGLSSTVTADAEASLNQNPVAVFGVHPQEVSQRVCESDAISIRNIHKMIAKRNLRDKEQVRSSADKMTHL